MLTVFLSARGMLVKSEVTSKKTNPYSSSRILRGILLISDTASKLSFSLNSLVVRGFSSLFQNHSQRYEKLNS